MPYLIDDKGNLFPTVHFMGHMGVEKKDILLQTKVGVPNPKGLSETFCITAVEMQLCGATVAACKAPGYYDTFVNGVITNDMNALKDGIIRLLKSDKPLKSFNDTIQEINKRFSLDVIKGEWIKLLNEIDESASLPQDVHNLCYRWKWLKYFLYKVKCCCPFLWRIIPVESVIQKTESWRNIRNL
jgi:glycosyltransferase involved in cell wall biosynthesis